MAHQALMWVCEYCGKTYKSKKIVDKHESACKSNPNSVNCLKCIHGSHNECGYICTKTNYPCSRYSALSCKLYEEV